MSSQSNNIFYIYTTGICDSGQLDNIFKYWQDFLCEKICNMIPNRFINIKITHSDILIDNYNIYQIEEEINNKLNNDFTPLHI